MWGQILGRYPIEQAVIVMKNFCAQNPNAASFTYVYPRRKRLLEQTLTVSALKQIESECNCVSTLCWLLCLLKKPQMKFWTFILAFLLRLFCSPSKPWVCCKIHLPSLILNVTTLIQANSCMWIQSWCHLWTSNLAYGFNNLFFSAWQI